MDFGAPVGAGKQYGTAYTSKGVTMSVESVEKPKTAAIEADARRMWRWSTFVHVGVGADDVSAADVPDHGAGDTDPGRFHAFVRLPNPLQHREIREKAMAAQARKARQLRDPEADANAILEGEIAQLSSGPKEPIIDAIVSRSWAQDYVAAMNELREDERFERIEHDRERAIELEGMEEDDRPADEYAELSRHLTAYTEALDKKVREQQDPQRSALERRSMKDLLGVYRENQIEAEAEEEYLHVYGAWEMVVGAFVPEGDNPRTFKRHFDSVADLSAQPEEVIEALRSALDDLRIAQQQGVTGGNS